MVFKGLWAIPVETANRSGTWGLAGRAQVQMKFLPSSALLRGGQTEVGTWWVSHSVVSDSL